MTIHKASKQRRDEQLRAFFAKLPRSETTGHLTKEGRESWKAWLATQGLGPESARRIIQFKEDSQPFNAAHAERCAEYLRKHGYKVIPPGG